jgi:hypothetical protein
MDKVWQIKDPADRSSPGKKQTGDTPVTTEQKNPAVAFTLSIFVWGSGQFYNDDWNLGTLLFLLMVNFYGFLGEAVFFRQHLTSVFHPYLSSHSNLLFAGWIATVFALLIWFSGALQAYRKAAKGRVEPFMGVEKWILPPLCSFLIPGWGQCLNGQFKKGALLLIASFLAYLAIPSIVVSYLLWPRLEPSFTRTILEWNFAVSLMAMPFLVLIWLVGIIDALKVSTDEVKKESWLKRLSYARNRIRLQGWGNTVFKRARIMLPLVLLLSLAVYGGSRFLPADYYESYARKISAKLSAREMVIVPRMINGFLEKYS